MKELERFLIMVWVVGKELVRENSDKKQASSIPNLWLTRGKLRQLVQKVGFLKKEESLRFLKLVKVKRHPLRPIKIYCREKTQLVQKLFFFCYYYYDSN